MKTQLQMTIYLNEADRLGEYPLFEEVLRRLMSAHVSGATVIRAWMGFGSHAFVHRKGLFGVSDDHPIVILTVDEADKIRAVVPVLKGIAPDSLITLHPVESA